MKDTELNVRQVIDIDLCDIIADFPRDTKWDINMIRGSLEMMSSKVLHQICEITPDDELFDPNDEVLVMLHISHEGIATDAIAQNTGITFLIGLTLMSMLKDEMSEYPCCDSVMIAVTESN